MPTFFTLALYFNITVKLEKHILSHILNILRQTDFNLDTENNDYTLKCTVVKFKFKTLTLFLTQCQIKKKSKLCPDHNFNIL